MKSILQNIRIAAVSVVALVIITGVLFPLILWGAAQLLFPRQANGSLVLRGGRVVGSTLIGQRFTSAKYFHPRPSAAGDSYDATASGGSNLGPTNPKLLSEVRDLATKYRRENGLADTAWIPVDAVTRSGSGLDPHITVENALLQVSRVAQARGLDPQTVRELVGAHTQGRALGIFGEPGVNVLTLNLALDGITAHETQPPR